MAIFASFVHCLPNILLTWPHGSFQVIRLSMILGIFQGHWTVSHQISQKRRVIRQKLLQTTNKKSYTSFRLVPLLMTLKYIWRSFQPRLSFSALEITAMKSSGHVTSPSDSVWPLLYSLTIVNNPLSLVVSEIFSVKKGRTHTRRTKRHPGTHPSYGWGNAKMMYPRTRTVAHLSINRARRWVTWLMRPAPLPSKPRRLRRYLSPRRNN